MAGKVKAWFQERWPFSEVFRLALDEEVPGGASFSYSFGSAILIAFTIQAVTGIMQLFYYVPSVQDAYRSVGYLQTHVPFGWLVHGLHYWGAQVILVLMYFHVARVFIWGAYKKPRELTWLSGVVQLILLMAFSLTGASLPWDQKGYWAGQVSTSVAGVIPVVGHAQKILLRGGENMGQLTITRFFGLHVMVLPAAIVGLMLFHIVAMRRAGFSGPWDERKRTVPGRFWPDQVLKDAVVGTILLVILLTLVVFLPYHFTGPANPLDTSYVPKPEWNFLFLYQALKFFQGPLEPVGAVAVPGFLIGFLVLLPFIDRKRERSPFRRPFVILSGFLLAVILVSLSIAGHLSKGYGTPAAVQGKKATTASSAAGPSAAGAPAPPASSPATPSPQGGAQKAVGGTSSAVVGDPAAGEAIFSRNCNGCHGPQGTKGLPNPGSTRGHVPTLNPAPSSLKSSDPGTFAQNIEGFLHQGGTPAGPSPSLSMPSFQGVLSEKQIADVAAYVMKLNGVVGARQQPAHAGTAAAASGTGGAGSALPTPSPAAVAPASTAAGEAASVIGDSRSGMQVFRNKCDGCHGKDGRKGIPNPGSVDGSVPALNPIDPAFVSKDPLAFARNVDRVVQHGSIPGGSPAMDMPAFGDKNMLDQPQIANVTAYIMELNGVDRAQIVNPGIKPGKFYAIALGLLLLIGLLLAGAWSRRSDPGSGKAEMKGER